MESLKDLEEKYKKIGNSGFTDDMMESSIKLDVIEEVKELVKDHIKRLEGLRDDTYSYVRLRELLEGRD